jgi:hypothetical protein
MKENSAEDFDSLFVKKHTGLKIFILIFCLVLLAFTSIYAYLCIGVVRDRMRVAQVQAEGTPQVNPSLIDLLKEKAWVESRLKMADGDSIGLSIDLEQHVIQLELKGVAVMTSKIRDYSISGFFKKMDGNVYFTMFGTPLTIQKFISSIEKNPLKLEKAPKSAEEAEATPDPAAVAKKDTLPKETVFWTVKLDREFDLNIQGIDSVSAAQSKYKLGKGFEFDRELKNIVNSFQHIIQFKKPTYIPEILICIPENEAKAILRALPRNALVTIRI